MTQPLISPTLVRARAEFEDLIKDVRPELHRYAARMVGSAIDGEDVVQETLAKAYYALPTLSEDANLRGWLFRIAHNKAIDFLRARKNEIFEPVDEFPPIAEPDSPLEKSELAAMALSVFLRLAPRQRSAVILKDVLGYSLAEISEFLNATVPEIKAVLHRGRSRLREFAANAEEEIKPVLSEQNKKLLAQYVKLFNRRDFDGVRDLLADEVRLDLVNRLKQSGTRQIRENYFHNYSLKNDWHFVLGAIENKAAILVSNPQEKSPEFDYFILLETQENKISAIRDFRYARYVLDSAHHSAA